MSQVLDNRPIKLAAFKDFVPEPFRFWIYICFAFVLQCSGGIYLAMASQMVGSLGLIQEDIMFAGYASFIGMTMIFPLLFPIKFRFYQKYIMLTAILGLVVCNLISMSTASLPILVLVCFVAGFCRMVGFFECMSTIQLRITPTRDFAKFFPVVYSFVLGCIQFSGIVSGYVAYVYSWQYMHLLIVGSLLVVALAIMILMKPFRPQSQMPPIKVDWLGLVLWSLLLMIAVFVLVYGEHYDWLHSSYIRLAIIYVLVLFCIIMFRAKLLKRNYIDFHVFGQKKVVTMLLLFAAMCILLSVPNVVQNAYTSAILHYDYLHTLALNWGVFAGIVAGALFSYWALVKMEMGYKLLTSVGFIMILFYLVMMYFLISPTTKIEMLYLPMFCRGAGNVIIYVVLTVYAARNIPFLIFFQALTVFGFIRTGIGTPLGNAIVERLFLVSERQTSLSLGMHLDAVNPVTQSMPFDAVLNEFQRQVMLVSVKEVFGYAVLAGILILLITLANRYRSLLKFKMPRWE